jgi:hypothetical protein
MVTKTSVGFLRVVPGKGVGGKHWGLQKPFSFKSNASEHTEIRKAVYCATGIVKKKRLPFPTSL